MFEEQEVGDAGNKALMGFKFQVRGHVSPHTPDSITVAGDMEHVISCLMIFRWTFRYTHTRAVNVTSALSCAASF